MTDTHDRWYRWLREVRHGGDAWQLEQLRPELDAIRDQVLDRASLRPGDTLLDVGTGDGLVAVDALDRVGPSGRVIFSDISADLLEHCRAAAADAGELSRCDFVAAYADKLTGIADGSVEPLSVMLEQALTPAELAAFGAHLRPLVEAGHGSDRRAVAYLTAGL